MRTIIVVLLATVLLAPVALADPPSSTGPFVGTVREHQTDRHRYDNNPENLACIQVIATYTVTLTYTPTTDVLTLTAGGETAVGSNGTATVVLERNFCTAFTILVEGTDVATVAAYEVTVTRSTGGAVPIPL